MPTTSYTHRKRATFVRALFVNVLLAMAAVASAPAIALSESAPSTPSAGEIKDGVYRFADIGWTMPIPPGWTVMPLQQTQQAQEVGKKAIQDAMGATVDMSTLRHLLAFAKDRANVFQSSFEDVPPEQVASWPEANANVREIVLRTYRAKRVNIDASPLREEVIAGVTFHVFDITIKDSKGTPFLYQSVYSALFGKQTLGVSLTYLTESNRDEMLKAFKASTFTATSR